MRSYQEHSSQLPSSNLMWKSIKKLSKLASPSTWLLMEAAERGSNILTERKIIKEIEQQVDSLCADIASSIIRNIAIQNLFLFTLAITSLTFKSPFIYYLACILMLAWNCKILYNNKHELLEMIKFGNLKAFVQSTIERRLYDHFETCKGIERWALNNLHQEFDLIAKKATEKIYPRIVSLISIWAGMLIFAFLIFRGILFPLIV